VYEVTTGRKLLTLQGSYRAFADEIEDLAAGSLSQTAWLMERHFIIPIGEYKERCMVCDFSRSHEQDAK
jgi:hypothetical protein